MEGLSNLLPVLAAVDPHRLRKLLVLFLSPVALDLRTGTISVLRFLILCRSPLVEMWVLLLMANQISLSLAILQVVNILWE